MPMAFMKDTPTLPPGFMTRRCLRLKTKPGQVSAHILQRKAIEVVAITCGVNDVLPASKQEEAGEDSWLESNIQGELLLV